MHEVNSVKGFSKRGSRAALTFLRDHYRYIFPSAIPLPAQRTREEVVHRRVRALAAVLAFGMPAWSILDSFAFDHSVWTSILIARLLAGAAFGSFLLLGKAFFRLGDGSLGVIYGELLTIFTISTLLHFFCVQLPSSVVDLSPVATSIADSYTLLPIVTVACLGFFPLALIESLAIASSLLAAYFWIIPTAHIALTGPDLSMGGVMTLIAGISVTISYSQLRMVTKLVDHSAYDSLTNCLGRRSGEEVIKALWHYSIRKKSHFSIAFIDLDHFKKVNDSFGHQTGDVVLANAAEVIKNSLRKSDFVTRWGGEEFLVIMPDAKLEDATMVLTRMSAKGFGTLPDGSNQTVSIGIAERMLDELGDEKLLIKTADERLYRAKTAGRGRAVGSEIVILPHPVKAAGMVK